MKKNILKNIEEIKQERELPENLKKNIRDKIIANGAIGISILILVIAFMVAANFLSKNITKIIYSSCSAVLLLFSLIVVEIAYHKDSGEWALTGIEIMILSIFALFSPYIFLRLRNEYLFTIMAFTTVYYVIKIIKLYCNEKNKYLSEISDISEIIKKESQDVKAQEEKNRIQEITQQKRNEKKEKIEEEKKQKDEETIKQKKEQPAKIKKKPGRKPKNEMKPEVTETAPKKRGRKPKSEVKEKIQEEIVEKTPKKRGRKPKVEITAEPIEIMPKKRGRKPKTEANQEKIDVEKKKRGRKPKSEIENKTKKQAKTTKKETK